MEDTNGDRTAFGQDRSKELAEKARAEMYRRALGIMESLSGRKIREGESAALLAGITRRLEDDDTNWWGLAMAVELAKDGYEFKDGTMTKVFKKQI
ncbi:MAG: hypothetical protein V3S25_11140 [Nitrospirales bacterium]